MLSVPPWDLGCCIRRAWSAGELRSPQVQPQETLDQPSFETSLASGAIETRTCWSPQQRHLRGRKVNGNSSQNGSGFLSLSFAPFLAPSLSLSFSLFLCFSLSFSLSLSLSLSLSRDMVEMCSKDGSHESKLKSKIQLTRGMGRVRPTSHVPFEDDGNLHVLMPRDASATLWDDPSMTSHCSSATNPQKYALEGQF